MLPNAFVIDNGFVISDQTAIVPPLPLIIAEALSTDDLAKYVDSAGM